MSSSEHLKLYRFAEEELSGQRSMHVISGVADVQAGKCVAWCPDATQQWTLAIGTAVPAARAAVHARQGTAISRDATGVSQHEKGDELDRCQHGRISHKQFGVS